MGHCELGLNIGQLEKGSLDEKNAFVDKILGQRKGGVVAMHRMLTTAVKLFREVYGPSLS